MYFHTYIIEKYCKYKLQNDIYSPSTFINTMPIRGNTDVLEQNGRCKVNRSRPTCSAFFVKNAIAKSVLDQMTHILHSPGICVQRNFLCTILCDKIIGNIEAYVFD